MSDKKSARLILEDGTTFTGYSFGAETATTGEVVFNTAMTGYPESLTDPSYSGQILVSTYPLVGNYGVPQKESEYGLLKFFESDRIHVKGLVISDYSFEYSHWNAGESLGEWLRENGVPGIWGIDTRQLTKIIRERGVMLGKIVVEGSAEPAAFDDPNLRNLAAEVSTPQVETYGDGPMKIVLVDCGCKYNIIRCLLSRGATVIRVPWDYDFTALDYDGVMLSNGPGDPQQCTATISNIKKAMALGKPIFGICRGVQVLNVGLGGSLYQDIPSQTEREFPIAHQQPFYYNIPCHRVNITENTLLHSICHGETQIAVNSSHHQCVHIPAPGLVVSAVAPDGIIEAVEKPDYPNFFLGVQWHPEYLWDRDEAAMGLFQAFMDACK